MVLREQGVPVAERTYRGWKHAQPSQRDLHDAVVIDAIRAVRVGDKGEPTPESLYGRRKMTALLRGSINSTWSVSVSPTLGHSGGNSLVPVGGHATAGSPDMCG